MQKAPFPEVVYVVVFMEGICPGPSRTKVFRVHSTTLDGAVYIAHNVGYIFKLAKIGWNGYNPSSTRAILSSMSTSTFSRPEPTYLSNAECDGEDIADLQAVE